MTSVNSWVAAPTDWSAEALALAGFGVWTWDMDSGDVRLSPLAQDLYGLDGSEVVEVETWRSAVAGYDRLIAEIAEAAPEAADVEATVSINLPGRPARWLRERSQVVEWRGETPLRLLGVCRDVTREYESDQRRRELIQELQHRIKNILAVVRSLARRTAEGSADVEDFSAHFEGRLAALARVQTALAHSAAGRIDLETLLREELLQTARIDDETAVIGGPHVELRAKLAEPFAVALHELCANAIKFGALSSDPGDLRIAWRTEEEGAILAFDWTEAHTAMTQEPGPPGFGLDFLRNGLAYEAGGQVDVEFPAGGFVCRIRVPLSEGP